MLLFFDTEFTGLQKNTDLISIGVIADKGRGSFYAELNDYNQSVYVDDWIREHVIKNLLWNQFESLNISQSYWGERGVFSPSGSELANMHVRMKGNRDEVSTAPMNWIEYIERDSLEKHQWVSDCSHYDMVLLIDLFGSALDFPWSKVCHDINQDISNYFGVEDYEAFNMNREDLLMSIPYTNIEIVKNRFFAATCEDFNNLKNPKHNSLWDAFVISELYHGFCCKPTETTNMQKE